MHPQMGTRGATESRENKRTFKSGFSVRRVPSRSDSAPTRTRCLDSDKVRWPNWDLRAQLHSQMISSGNQWHDDSRRQLEAWRRIITQMNATLHLSLTKRSTAILVGCNSCIELRTFAGTVLCSVLGDYKLPHVKFFFFDGKSEPSCSNLSLV
jgi:hypothetical protein